MSPLLHVISEDVSTLISEDAPVAIDKSLGHFLHPLLSLFSEDPRRGWHFFFPKTH